MTVIPRGDTGGVTLMDESRVEVAGDSGMAGVLERVRSGEVRARELTGEVLALGARVAALQGRLAVKLAELDAAGGCEGFRSVGAWAGWHLGLPAGEARKLGKVAAALPELPVLAEACAGGSVPLAAAAMVADVVTPETEAKIVDLARDCTGSQLSTICRDYRTATNDDESVPAPEPFLSFNEDRGGYRVGGWLPVLDGDRVRNGLQAELDRLFDEAGDGNRSSEAARPTRVDALSAMAERALAEDATTVERAEKFLTLIHVELDGHIRLGDGVALDVETFKSILGQSSFSWLLTLRGSPLWTTHKIRTANRAMRRALRARDRSCVYPGCGNVGYLDAHHLIAHAERPETCLEGLALVCWHHHRWLHDHDERLERQPDRTYLVYRADGTVWTGKRPPPTDPDPPDPDVATHRRAFIGDQLTNYARDVILEHLLTHRPTPTETDTDP